MYISTYDAEDNSELINEELLLDETIEFFYYLSEKEGSFLTIKNLDRTVIQLMWVNNNTWLVDIPLKPSLNKTHVSLQKYADYDGCIEAVKASYNNIVIHHLYKVSIMEETLDDVINDTSQRCEIRLVE